MKKCDREKKTGFSVNSFDSIPKQSRHPTPTDRINRPFSPIRILPGTKTDMIRSNKMQFQQAINFHPTFHPNELASLKTYRGDK